MELVSFLARRGMLRRLHFESTTLMVALVKQKVDGDAAGRAETVKKSTNCRRGASRALSAGARRGLMRFNAIKDRASAQIEN